MSDFIYKAFSAEMPTVQNAKEYNLFKKENNLIKRKAKRIRGIERLQGVKIAPAPASREGNGCGGLVVRIEDCGSSDPGSNPGRGPTPFRGGNPEYARGFPLSQPSNNMIGVVE